MRPELTAVTIDIARVREDVMQGTPTAALLARIDDALTEGYACALAGDSWAMRAEQDLHDLISNTELPIRARALRTLAREHALLQRDLIALRRELAALSGDRHRLVAGPATRSA
jgi:hypothetical protein